MGADYETGAERANALHKWLDGQTFFSATIPTVRRDHIHQTVHETPRGCDHISFSAEYQVQRGATDNSDTQPTQGACRSPKWRRRPDRRLPRPCRRRRRGSPP